MIYIKSDGDKPVLNEIVLEDFTEAAPQKIGSENEKSQPENKTQSEKQAETAETSPQIDKSLKDGMRLFKMRRWENALREFLEVKSENFDEKNRAELAYYLALCYTKLEKYDDAVLYLEQVVTYGKDVLRVYQCRMTLAYIYIMTGKTKMAEFELKRLQNNGFESAPMYNTLAYSAYIQKRYKNAVEFYEKALDIDKNNATALNSMGYILSDTGLDREKGLNFCRKAVERNPKNAAYLDSLGWAHFRCGNYSEARNWMSRAVEIAPKEKEIKEHYRIVTGGRW